jgi:hypothetical protein
MSSNARSDFHAILVDNAEHGDPNLLAEGVRMYMVGTQKADFSYAITAEANSESSCLVNARAHCRAIRHASAADNIRDVNILRKG